MVTPVPIRPARRRRPRFRVAGPAAAVAAALLTATLTATLTDTAANAATGTKVVSWGAVTVRVPASWPVYDLRSDPTRCLRFDVHAVYLGAAPAQPNCPAHLVGRTDALQLLPADTATRSAAGLAGPSSRSVGRDLGALGVVATASYGGDDRSARALLATIRPSGAPAIAPAIGPATAPAVAAPPAVAAGPRAAAQAPAATAAGYGPGVYTGLGFDACSAPSSATMTAWLASPYRSLGIYLGGSNRACGDGNLTASWVSSVTAQGWKLAPLYVGDQAPCVNQGGLALFSTDPATAANQGTGSATDAVAHAKNFGLPSGSPIYYDLEAYGSDSTCVTAVYSFLDAWTVELHRLGYHSAVYSSSSSGISDLGKATSRPGFHVPDGVWLANWNGVHSVFGDPYISDTYWANHQRLHQYSGGHDETYGGVTINIDGDYDDGLVVTGGGGSRIDYGAGTYGPGAAGFSTTGSWSSGAPEGYRGAMLWTYSSGSPATASATWTPSLSPGQYDVAAFVPSDHAGGHARYTVTGAISTLRTIDQGAYSNDFVSLGRFTTAGSGRLSVRLTNDGDPPGAHTIGADAMRFTRAASGGSAAWRVPADFTGDGRADVAVWRPSSGDWYVRGQPAVRYGRPGDVPVAADFTGDGRADMAVWRPSSGDWYFRGRPPVHYGTAGDIPVTANFSGDRRAEAAIWRPSTGVWYLPGVAPVRWGSPGDVPVAADFTGDGRADIAVWRPSTGTWYVHGYPPIRYGTGGDVPLAANLYGDGRADIAVWRPSNGVWYVRGLPNVQYGAAGDVPVPGSFLRAHRAGVAIWRPANGGWYLRGQPTTVYGVRGDIPV